MHIVSASDDGYLPHFAAMLHSAWLYHPTAHFYLLDAGLTSESLGKLETFVHDRAIDLMIIPCVEVLVGRLIDVKNHSLYARWLIPEFLHEVDRALYIDADTIVVKALEDLFAVELDGHPLAAVSDNIEPVHGWDRAIRGLDFGSQYFNSGVLIMNLKQWRNEGFSESAFLLARKYANDLIYPDQSILNHILRQNFVELDPIWNFMAPIEIEDLQGGPHILHLLGTTRPTRWPESPYADLYKYHRDQTPWPFTKLPARPLKYMTRRLGAFAGIARYKRNIEEYRLLDVVRTTVAEPALREAQELVAQSAIRLAAFRNDFPTASRSVLHPDGR